MTYDPEMDGVDHINVYSKGRTNLGRWLSNFAHIGFNHPVHGTFQSVEGFWYWLGCRDGSLRPLSGFAAKQRGRELGTHYHLEEEEFKEEIRKAIACKVWQNPVLWKAMEHSILPFEHYYVFGSKVVEVPEYAWIVEFLEELRAEIGGGP